MDEDRPSHIDPVLVAGNEDLINYREPSRAAVVSLVLGLLSILVTSSLLFLPVPTLALVLGAVGLWRIGHSDYLTGRKMALTGMGLGAFWIAFAVVNARVESQLAKSAAEQMATPWVELLIDGRVLEAHQLMQDPRSRFSPETDLASQYEDDELAQEDLDRIRQGQVVQKLEEYSDRKLVPIPLGRGRVEQTEGTWHVATDFDIRDVSSGETLLTVRVFMRRQQAQGEDGPYFQWRADGIDLVE